MGKRKANIFNVAESVVKWFEASSHSIAPTEITKGVANRSEIRGEVAGQSNVAEAAANGIEATSWPKATPEGETSAEVANPGGTEVVGEPGPPAAAELG